jgi:hypothetical protein
MTACARCGAETGGSYRCADCTGLELPKANTTAAEESQRKRAQGWYMPWRFDVLGLMLRGLVGKRDGS